MKIILNGALGRMGHEVEELVNNGYKDITIGAFCDAKSETPEVYSDISSVTGKYDAIVDFSHHSSCADLCAYAVKTSTPLVIATTGHTDDEKAAIKAASEKIPVFFSPNMAPGVAFLNAVAKKAAAFFKGADIEIVERHHKNKLDAPSGTAKMLASSISSVTGGNIVSGRDGICPRKDGDIGVSAVRGGNVKGIHERTFYNKNDTFTITHTAESRGMFAEGALSAAVFVADKKPGLYDMDDLYGDIL